MAKLFSILLLSIFILAGCSSSGEATSITVMLDYAPNTNHIGIYNAIEEGYYEEVGLTVTVAQSTDVPTETVVAQNEAQFGISYQENVSMAVDQGMPIKSIYTIYDTNTSGLMMANEEVWQKDTLTYCGWGSEIETAIINHIAEESGKEITFMNATGGFVTTPEGSGCDIWWEFLGWAPEQAKLAGMDYYFIPITDFTLNFYSPVIITNDQVSDEIITDFIGATTKGYNYAVTNQAESVENFMNQNPDSDEELITNSLDVTTQYQSEDGYQEEQIWADFSSFLIENEIVSSEFDYTTAYTNEYVEAK